MSIYIVFSFKCVSVYPSVSCMYICLYVVCFNNKNVPSARTAKTFENDLNKKAKTAAM